MKKKERARFILDILNGLFPNPEIPLSHTDSYSLLIAVLLSAQCTDLRVNQVTPKLFSQASSPLEMINLTKEQIEDIIRPCGLGKTKANAIWELSKILLEKHKGVVPQNIQELEKLPGVGHKTASVVMAQAFNQPAFPIDTHIHRCAKRWKLSKAANVTQTEEDLKKVFPKDSWIRLHLQIIYFARKFCPARGHMIKKCPICSALTGSH